MFDTTKRYLFQIEDMETGINFVNRTSYTQVRRNATHIFGHKRSQNGFCWSCERLPDTERFFGT